MRGCGKAATQHAHDIDRWISVNWIVAHDSWGPKVQRRRDGPPIAVLQQHKGHHTSLQTQPAGLGSCIWLHLHSWHCSLHPGLQQYPHQHGSCAPQWWASGNQFSALSYSQFAAHYLKVMAPRTARSQSGASCGQRREGPARSVPGLATNLNLRQLACGRQGHTCKVLGKL